MFKSGLTNLNAFDSAKGFQPAEGRLPIRRKTLVLPASDWCTGLRHLLYNHIGRQIYLSLCCNLLRAGKPAPLNPKKEKGNDGTVPSSGMVDTYA